MPYPDIVAALGQRPNRTGNHADAILVVLALRSARRFASPPPKIRLHCTLTVLELWLAFLGKRCHALLLVFRRESGVE
jgi:hypothetical protein